jgi:hypothetical protein
MFLFLQKQVMHTKLDICFYFYKNKSCTLNWISMFIFLQKQVMHTKLDIYVFIFTKTSHAH